jgi:hypothetical protein
VKYPDCVGGNDIVQDFNQVRLAVKADDQMFVFCIGIVLVKKTVVFGIRMRAFDGSTLGGLLV